MFFFGVSEDLIKRVQFLLESGQGDNERLRKILEALQKGEPLDNSDKNYLQELADQPRHDLTTEGSDVSLDAVTPTSNASEDISAPSTPYATSHEKKDVITKTISRKRVAKVAAIIAVLVLAYVASDVYAVSTLQFRPHHGSQYVISQTQLFIQGEVCNPSYFPASFSNYEINAVYKSESIEKAEISGSTITPKTFAILDGKFDLNKDAVTRLQQQNEKFDPTQAHITTTINAPIFGVIPFSVVKEYSADQFQQVLKNGPPGSFSCE
jgi:hypothetical protein